jgi:hypothetical protein
VSDALARLANAGLVSGHGDEWHFHGSVEDYLVTMMEPHVSRVEQLVRSVRASARPER